MERGDLYIAESPVPDPRRQRVYLVVSRDELIASRYSTLICVPVYSTRMGVLTEVHLGTEHGLKAASAARCDEITSVSRNTFRRFVGHVPPAKMREVRRAMVVALGIEPEDTFQ